MQLLTTAEAADYLKLSERKLYELVAEQRIPCTKATGKWLFPRAELDRWVLAGLSRPPGLLPPIPPAIVGGSHDPLLEWALRESGSGLASLPEGSEAGYRRLLEGEVAMAAIHFHDLEHADADANVATVSREPGLADAVLIGFATREQGLLTAPGNPMELASLADVAGKHARFAMRPGGAGARQLLQALLRRERADLGALVAAEGIAPTGPDIAQAIRAGRADCGIATRSVAIGSGLPFLPLAYEHFDLLMRQRDYFRPPLQAFIALVQSPRLAARAAELGGLDVAAAGRIRWAP